MYPNTSEILSQARDMQQDTEKLMDAYAVHLVIKDGRKEDKVKTSATEQRKEQDGNMHERLALATGRSRGQGRQSVSGSADTHETEEDGPALLDSQWKSLWAVEKVWHQRLPELTGSGQFLHSGKEQDCNRMSQEQLAVYESSTAAILAIKALEAWEQQRSI
mmetsp:Transcript_27592/g.78034  ORF Transcript_27592/g.78034 Transcript_27592/m.78034 type:complete len:162 (-) Transcript_27592:561-1046(-)